MRIGALGAAAATTAKTIRYYEQAGLLPAPARTASGYRDYPPDSVHRLAFIRTARDAGLSLAEIREILAIRDRGQPPCAEVAALINEHLAQLDRRIAELQQTRAALGDLARRAAATSPEECTDEDICRILTAARLPAVQHRRRAAARQWRRPLASPTASPARPGSVSASSVRRFPW